MLVCVVIHLDIILPSVHKVDRTNQIGKDADSQIGTARKTIIASHFAPGHWCCATADLVSRRLVYYDPFYDGPRRTGALSALGACVDQVSHKQRANVAIGAAAFERKAHSTPRQPGNISRVSAFS